MTLTMAPETLTDREAEILHHVTVPGGSRKRAAKVLGISHASVDYHLERAFRKLGVDNIGAAARAYWGPQAPR